MAKSPKMRVCRNCNTEIAAKAKKCPACGARQKGPFYQRGWFIFLVILVVFGIVNSGIRKNSEKNAEKAERANEYRWPDSQLASMIPRPESNHGRIVSESESRFDMNVYEISKEQFEDYIEGCKDSGFTVDYSRMDTYYLANDGEGYSLSLMFDEDKEELKISLNAPKPQETESSALAGSGREPDGQESEQSEREESSQPEENGDGTEETDGTEPADGDGGDELIDGMRPEFKEAMDSYEAFYEEYCELMEQYGDNPSDLSLLKKYTEFMTKAQEVEEKFNAWEGDMNDAELKYYTEVSMRISQKLLETSKELPQ